MVQSNSWIDLPLGKRHGIARRVLLVRLVTVHSSHCKCKLGSFYPQKCQLIKMSLITSSSYLFVFVLLFHHAWSDKKIWFGTKFFHYTDWYMNSWYPRYKELCTKHTCRFYSSTETRVPASSYDAIIFHSLDLPWLLKSAHLPPQQDRTNQQVYVFYSLESPNMDMQDLKAYNGFFNWTMTYRLDSDIYTPYNAIQETGSNTKWNYPPKSWKPVIEKWPNNLKVGEKKYLVSWLVSNCKVPSRREHFVDKLRQYIPVYQRGSCNNDRCDDSCFHDLFSNSKFYLAFENSNCEDYVTEKFWTCLDKGVVPIVLGDVGYAKIAPPHSYINAQDFSTISDLADYLKFLDSNDEVYGQYFWWRDHYRLVQTKGNRNIMAQGMCQLCEKLHEDPVKSQTYNITDWWEFNKCTVPFTEDWFSVHNYMDRLLPLDLVFVFSVACNLALVVFLLRFRINRMCFSFPGFRYSRILP